MNNTHKLLQLREDRLEKELEEALYINDQKDASLAKMVSCMADKYARMSKRELKKHVEWLQRIPN